MKVSLIGLQRNSIASWNSLIDLVKRSKRTIHADVIIDSYELERKLASLREDIVMLAALIDPDSAQSLLDDESINVGYWEADEEE